MVQPVVGWLHCFWVMVRQIVRAEGHGTKLLTPWWLGSRGRKALGISFQAYLPVRTHALLFSTSQQCQRMNLLMKPGPQWPSRFPESLLWTLLHSNWAFNIGALWEENLYRLSSGLPTHATWLGEEREGRVLTFPIFTDAEMFWLRN